MIHFPISKTYTDNFDYWCGYSQTKTKKGRGRFIKLYSTNYYHLTRLALDNHKPKTTVFKNPKGYFIKVTEIDEAPKLFSSDFIRGMLDAAIIEGTYVISHRYLDTIIIRLKQLFPKLGEQLPRITRTNAYSLNTEWSPEIAKRVCRELLHERRHPDNRLWQL